MFARGDLVIRELGRQELHDAARVLAAGMRDNPTHRNIFGRDADRRETRLKRFYRFALPPLHRRAAILGAYRESTLVAVLALAPPGRCQPSVLEPLRVVPAFSYGAGPMVAMRVKRWMKAWAQRDLTEPHWHLGPAAVHPDSRGIGGVLLSRVCQWLDRREATAYLETERFRNVRVYENFGFRVIGEGSILETPCWFMLRTPWAQPVREVDAL